MKIFYRVPDHCKDSWIEIEVGYPTWKEGYQKLIAHDAAADYAEDSENLTDWVNGDALTFEFSLIEGGEILFSRKISAATDIALSVLNAE